MGRNGDEIDDIWQSAYVASYFRSGVTLNNALSGIDGALWDILGKRCDVPVYKLLGGKVRTAVPLYGHASARDLSELEDQVRKWMSATGTSGCNWLCRASPAMVFKPRPLRRYKRCGRPAPRRR